MKTIRYCLYSGILTLAAVGIHAQTFRDLNFEQANPIIDPGGPFYPYDVTTASALPGWTAYLGNVQQSDVLQNFPTTGTANISILGPNYPSAGTLPSQTPGTIDGNYSVLLQAGGLQVGTGIEFVGASIEQTGLVSSLAKSIEFKAWETPSTQFTVSFDGNILTPVELGGGANYDLYAIDVSQYAGQVGTLEFTALFGDHSSWLGLDDISFSQTAVTPEPTPIILAGIGGLIFALRRRFDSR